MSKKTYAKALFESVEWLPDSFKEVDIEVQNTSAKPVEEFSKQEALESMQKFTENVLGDKKTEKVVINDVEIKRESPKANYTLKENATELAGKLLENHPERLKALNSVKDIQLFCVVSEFIIEDDSSIQAGFAAGLEKEQAELFSKMIKAMKLTEDQVWLSSASDPEIMHAELCHLNPKFVISLGAVATHKLMNKKVRLTLVQGEFFSYLVDYQGQNKEFLFMPLFHPEYLLINPNMKRKTWNGMQKLMERL